MKNVLVLAVFIVMLQLSHSAVAQTSSDFTKSFGESISVYSAGDHILITPEYATDGQVCRIGVSPRHFAGKVNNLGNQLPFDELITVLDKLVPREARGARKGPFGQTTTGGGSAWTTYSYEKVTFVFLSSLKLASASTGLRPYSFSVTFPTNEPTSSESGGDEFTQSDAFPVELVVITWNFRKCADRAAGAP